MFVYYLDLAVRSLKRNPGITLLMVLSIGIGVALAMSTWALERGMSHDPIPHKSAKLFFPTVDMWGPSAHGKGNDSKDPPKLLDYATAEALLQDHRAKFQSAVYWITPTVVPSRPGQHPFNASAFAVSGEFFPMLDVPFKYGSGWSDADDAARAQVVVISEALNNKLFGGRNSIGKTLNIRNRNFRVVGVFARWNPQPVFYDVPAFGGYMLRPIALYVPFNTAVATELPPVGATGCAKPPEQPGLAGFIHSSCAWISYLVQLDDARAVGAYKRYLDGFAGKRFDWPPNVRLHDLMGWLDYLQAVPAGVKILRLVGFGLLIVCLVDTMGLMLAKFLRRSGEIGVRRALGAPRRAIYAQFLTEGAVVGAAGGLLGIVFTWLAMLWLRMKFPDHWLDMTQVDPSLLGVTLGVAVFATLLAAIYPTWRAAHVHPAWQIKSN